MNLEEEPEIQVIEENGASESPRKSKKVRKDFKNIIFVFRTRKTSRVDKLKKKKMVKTMFPGTRIPQDLLKGTIMM